MKAHTGKWVGVMLHHTAGSTSDKEEQIKKIHMAPPKKWGDIGYHFVLETDTKTKTSKIVSGRDLKYAGSHAGVNAYNNGYIGVCVPGNYETGKMPDWLYNQILGHICHIMKKYSAYGFLGHREVKATACPGKNINLNQIRKDLSAKLGREIKAIKL